MSVFSRTIAETCKFSLEKKRLGWGMTEVLSWWKGCRAEGRISLCHLAGVGESNREGDFRSAEGRTA